MTRLSLFKFSRYFFVLFLTGTVAPLAGLLIWNDGQLTHFNEGRHRQFIEMISQDLADQVQQARWQNLEAMERVKQALHGKPLALSQYRELLDTVDVWWFDSIPETFVSAPDPLDFQKSKFHERLASGKHVSGFRNDTDPIRQLLKRFNGKAIISDYAIYRDTLVLVSILPVTNGHRGLVVVTPMRLDAFMPPGPNEIDIFIGSQVTPAARLRYHHTAPYHHLKGMFQKGGPPPFPPPPHPPGFHPDHGPPPFSKIVKLIPITEQTGRTVATIRLRLREMPRPEKAERPWIGFMILLTGLLSSLIAGRYIHRNFIVPLMRLSLLTTHVQHGDLSSRAFVSDVRQEEVRNTLQSFNTMLEQLEEKERLRNNFISNLTHDFRTPLIAQARALELLIRDFEAVQPEKTAQERGGALLARNLLQNNRHLLGMVNQLLETYQFEEGQLKLCLDNIVVTAIVDHAFESLISLANARHIALTRHFPDRFPDILGDETCLKRVFINLIANAIENIPKGSEIQVSGDMDSTSHIIVHVRDNGQGIDPEEQKHLFDRYYAGLGDTRKLGSGLGLYICKMFVEAHQGTIQVESIPGSYTDFIIRLPVRATNNTGKGAPR
jgi:signal transduction histidine kinase